MTTDIRACRFLFVDAELIPVIYPDGTWKKQLMAIYVCTHPTREREEAKHAAAQGLPGVMCTATITGHCPRFQPLEFSKRKR